MSHEIVSAYASERNELREKSAAGEALRKLIANRFAWMGSLLLILITLLSIFAPILSPHDPFQINATDRLTSVGDRTYPLGTDQLGRDVLSRLIHGGRISLGVGLATVILCNIVGLAIGLASGFYRRLDSPLMRLMDAFMAFPSILLALGIVAVLGQATSNVVIALTIVYTPRVARLVRSSVLTIRELDYIAAARAIGQRDVRIMIRHILPNCMGPIIVQGTFIFAYAVIAEASLSFLGVGASPETPSWGNMLSEARQFMRAAPSLALMPGITIMLTVLSLNLLGDGLRDILDPHSRESRGTD